jgi:uncharacterized protein YbjT (DUF2867 family)
MKFVIIGGSGLIGSKVVSNLHARGHEVLSASPRSGVNVVTGEGLTDALSGADVVVDVSNSPSFADDDVLAFFTASSRNLLAAEAAAGVKHHVALSVVGADRIPDSGYMRAKVAQENLIKTGKVPYTILRATQFFEFLGPIAGSGGTGDVVQLPSGLMQPIAAADVANALTDVAVKPPANGTLDLAGPEAVPMNEIVERYLRATGDTRRVQGDTQARYYGAKLDDRSLVPAGKALKGATRFEDWFSQQAKS